MLCTRDGKVLRMHYTEYLSIWILFCCALFICLFQNHQQKTPNQENITRISLEKEPLSAYIYTRHVQVQHKTFFPTTKFKFHKQTMPPIFKISKMGWGRVVQCVPATSASQWHIFSGVHLILLRVCGCYPWPLSQIPLETYTGTTEIVSF